MSSRDESLIGSTGWAVCDYTSAGRFSMIAGDMRACRIMFDRWRQRILFRRRTRLLVLASSSASFEMTYGEPSTAIRSIVKIRPTTVSVLSTWYTPWEFVTRNPALPTIRHGGMIGGFANAVTIDTIPASNHGIVVSANSTTVRLLIARL